MRHLNGVYTQRYNRLHGYDGQLFRGRYKSILVEEDSYLLELTRYIHRNPVRAGIVKNIDQYDWSSHPGYLSSAKKWRWLQKDFILTMLTAKKKKQQKAYRKFMVQEESDELLNFFERKKMPPLLGGEKFASWVKETFFQEKQDREVPGSLQLAPDRARIIKEVCRGYQVKKKDLLTKRRGHINEPRDVAMYLCRILRNDTFNTMGETFGLTGYSSACSAVGRVQSLAAKII